jgi:hypothetical protein
MLKIQKITYILFVLLVVFIQTEKVEAAENLATTTAESAPLIPRTVEVQVRDFFTDTPVMIDIARCESNFRQFTDSGSVLRGGGGEFVGVFQIYESVHAEAARALGFDITNVAGNMAYAKHLYYESGTTPWKSCVPSVVSTAPTIATSNFQKIEQIKLLNQIIVLLKQVMALQALLAGR